MLGRVIGEDVALEVDVPHEPATVEVDPAQIEQVVINLAVNARDAMPLGGRLSISVAPLEGGERDWVSLTVADTGAGIPAEALEHVFEPFFTTKDAIARHGPRPLDRLRHRRSRAAATSGSTASPAVGRRSRSTCRGPRAPPRRPPHRGSRHAGGTGARPCCSSRTTSRCATSPAACSRTAATRSSRPPTRRGARARDRARRDDRPAPHGHRPARRERPRARRAAPRATPRAPRPVYVRLLGRGDRPARHPGGRGPLPREAVHRRAALPAGARDARRVAQAEQPARREAGEQAWP